jgi:AcrR family transcriptional regulator
MSTPGRPLRADAQRNRQRILETARKAFGIDGPGVSLDEIARRAGVGPGTIHRHFPAKEALIDAVLVEHLLELAEHAHAATELLPFLRSLIAESAAKQDLTDALSGVGGVPSPSAEAAARDLRDAFAGLLRRAQKSGLVRADVDAEDVQAVVIGAVAAQRYRSDSGHVAELVLDGLRPRR